MNLYCFKKINLFTWNFIVLQKFINFFRFEGVHPNIYSIYELLQGVADLDLQNQIREHVIKIEGKCY